jgi:hypothetical protein
MDSQISRRKLPQTMSPGPVRLARGCLMAERACELARWVGRPGRPVTSGRVLRRADVTAAGAMLGGVGADPGANGGRCAGPAPAMELRSRRGTVEKISGSVAAAEPALKQWSSSTDAEVVDAWWAGFRAVCAAESDSWQERSVITLALAFLEAVAVQDGPDPNSLWQRVVEIVERREEDEDWSERVYAHSLTQYMDRDTRDPFAGLVDLLGQLGAVTSDDSGTVAVTALGRWELSTAQADRPRTISTDPPADVVAGLLADHVRRGTNPWPVVRRWLEPRRPADAARELLTAAADLSAAARIGAGDVADSLGDEALAAWQAVAHLPNLGAHARVSLASAEDEDPAVAPADTRWLAVEFAAATLEGPGPDEALTVLFDRVPGGSLDARLDAVAGTGHPDAARVTAAVREFVITLERTEERKLGTRYPLCTGFAGDSPVEYWSEDDPQEAEPFDLAEINRSFDRLDDTNDEGR